MNEPDLIIRCCYEAKKLQSRGASLTWPDQSLNQIDYRYYNHKDITYQVRYL